jgi:predicted urease superfamily metal-dependent hydrolase
LFRPKLGFPGLHVSGTGVRLCSNTLLRALHRALEFGTHIEAHVEKVDRMVIFLVGVSRVIAFSAFLIPGGKLHS